MRGLRSCLGSEGGRQRMAPARLGTLYSVQLHAAACTCYRYALHIKYRPLGRGNMIPGHQKDNVGTVPPPRRRLAFPCLAFCPFLSYKPSSHTTSFFSLCFILFVGYYFILLFCVCLSVSHRLGWGGFLPLRLWFRKRRAEINDDESCRVDCE